MKRIAATVGIIVLLSLSLFSAQPTNAQSRYATCDVCGYCPDSYPTPPTKWASCAKCLYPSLYPLEGTPDPVQKQSLLIDDATNLPPQTAKGHIYTVFGCIKTDLNDFTQTGAAQSLVQVLLNVIFITAGGVAFLYLIYGSFILITSQADPERLAYGKRVVLGAIIGLAFTLGSVFVINLLASNVLGLPGFTSVTPTPTP